jgi:hypothetical protein
VLLAYSARNRSASVRIPWTESPKAKRVEARFPDPSANPYLAFSALLMAGLDGIKNKIDPGEASRQGPLRPAARGTRRDPDRLRQRLREALRSLEADHEFLLHGDVFTKDQIEGYMALKWDEVYASSTPRTRSSTRCTTPADPPPQRRAHRPEAAVPHGKQNREQGEPREEPVDCPLPGVLGQHVTDRSGNPDQHECAQPVDHRLHAMREGRLRAQGRRHVPPQRRGRPRVHPHPAKEPQRQHSGPPAPSKRRSAARRSLA